MIDVKGLVKEYRVRKEHSILRKKKVRALKGISFKVKEGEFVGYLGPNGSGKSTTIKILSGIIYPTRGEVKVMGYIPWEDRIEYVSHIGVVLGSKSSLFWDLPAIDSLKFMRAVYRIPKSEFEARLRKYCDVLGLKKLLTRRVRNLSLGERMKFNFVAAVLHDPQIFFLDEPTIAVDAVSKDDLRQFMKELNKEGKTMILTTHDMEDVENLCRRLILLNEGEILFDGNIKDFKRRHANFKLLKVEVESFKHKRNFMKIVKEHEHKIEANMFSIRVKDWSEAQSLLNKLRRHAELIDVDISNPSLHFIVSSVYRNLKKGEEQ